MLPVIAQSQDWNGAGGLTFVIAALYKKGWRCWILEQRHPGCHSIFLKVIDRELAFFRV
jgi:hypothetical protein